MTVNPGDMQLNYEKMKKNNDEQNIIRNAIDRIQYRHSLLKLNNQDIARKKIVLMAGILYTILFTVSALIQSGKLNLNANQTMFASNLLTCLCLLLSLTFIVTSLYNVLYLEREKRKILKELEKIEQPEVCKSETSSSMKVANLFDKHANKVDLTGSFLTTIMQAVAVFSITVPAIFNLSKIPQGTAFNLHDICDVIGNILFTAATGMFLLAYLIRNKRAKNNNRNKLDPMKCLLTVMFIANLLILVGKVLVACEARSGAIYTGRSGGFPNVDAFPLGFIFRAIGMATFSICCVLLLYYAIKTNQELKEEVDKIRIRAICDIMDTVDGDNLSIASALSESSTSELLSPGKNKAL